MKSKTSISMSLQLLKAAARGMKQATGQSHVSCLNHLARQIGYASYDLMRECIGVRESAPAAAGVDALQRDLVITSRLIGTQTRYLAGVTEPGYRARVSYILNILEKHAQALESRIEAECLLATIAQSEEVLQCEEVQVE